jgi:hypothetical protein
MRPGLLLMSLAGAVILLTGLGYTTTIYNPLHAYWGEPSWERAALGAFMLIVGVYGRRFVRAQ